MKRGKETMVYFRLLRLAFTRELEGAGDMNLE